jgi:gamma-glutamyltranspeptidase/glutathione hydrolase
MVERAGLDGLKHNETDYIHLITETLKGAFADREYYYGDPLFVDVGLETLLSVEHVAKRVGGIDPKVAMPDMPPDLYHNSKIPKATITPSEAPSERDPDTSYLCVVDRWGNAFSATPSDASWWAPVVPGLGIVPSGRGTQSRPDPNHPSGVAPGKRPRLTPNPAMLLRDDGSVMPFGAPGGDAQVQAMLQVVLNAFHFGMDIQEAIDAPRFMTMSFPNSFAPYNHYPGLLGLEGRFPSNTLDELITLGHKIEAFPDYSRRLASVEAVLYEPTSGFFRSGADSRQPAYAITV